MQLIQVSVLIEQPLILHLETATESCSVALSRGAELLAFAEAEEMTHAASITLLIQDCLNQSNIKAKDLAAISVSRGPGSYTALRVGSSVAKGMCYALKIPLLAIDTLQALAIAAAAEINDENVLYAPMIDARRMEVYTALYNAEGDVVKAMESIIINEQSDADFLAFNRKIVLTGNCVDKCKEILISPSYIYLPKKYSAKYLIKLAYQLFIDRNFVDISVYSPEYAKQPNITTAKKIF